MKKLMNDPRNLVPEMVEGMVAADPGLARLDRFNVIVRSDVDAIRNTQVAIVSGGGSGHEPAHAGYVGPGMLTAAVAGEIFTSPTVAAVHATIRAVAGPRGVLLIVKNYTGDRLNFGLAAELARSEGISVDTVVVGDDVALLHEPNTAGPRGIAGTVLVHKIAGASAAAGLSLEAVARNARGAASDVATMGLSLSAGIVPAVGKPNYSLSEQEVELGLGIHGEPGVEKVALAPADELVDKILSRIIRAKTFHEGDRTVLLINNLGATTPMELAVVARHCLRQLRAHRVVVERVYSGVFMSSLDTAGISLSLLRVNDERLRLLDAPTLAPGWHAVTSARCEPIEARTIETPVLESGEEITHEVKTAEGKLFRDAAKAACEALIAAENRLTKLDQAVGDGDLGISFVRGASAIEKNLAKFPFDRPAVALKEIALKLQDHMGGSSGPLYGTLLIRAGLSLTDAEINAGSWAAALEAGCQAVSEVGGAKLGDRTMLDALVPFAKTLKALFEKAGSGTDARVALSAAERGAETTAQMMPKRGRSSYLGSRALGHPDPGAVAAVVWLRAIVDTVAGT